MCPSLVLVAAAFPGGLAFRVPADWEKVYDGPAPAAFLTARDGYAAWSDQVLVPGTENWRAQLFTHTLFRRKAGDREPETLWTGKDTSNAVVHLLGPGGAVAAGRFADCRTLYLPGRPPIPLPKNARYAAKHFTADGLVCLAERWEKDAYHYAVVLFPIDRRKGAVGPARVLRPWVAAPLRGAEGFTPDFGYGRVLLRGDFLVSTGAMPDPARPDWATAATEVWDVRAGKLAWREYGVAEAADDTHAYWFPGDGTTDIHLPPTRAVARRRLDGKEPAERRTLPREVVRVDPHPPRAFVLDHAGDDWAFVRLDLSTSGRAEYPVRVPDNRRGDLFRGPDDPRNPFVRGAEGAEARLPLRVDTETGEVRVLSGGAVYRVPPARGVPADGEPKWEPLAPK